MPNHEMRGHHHQGDSQSNVDVYPLTNHPAGDIDDDAPKMKKKLGLPNHMMHPI